MFWFSVGKIQAGIRKCPNSKVNSTNDVVELRNININININYKKN